ncbi:hypothetical protein H310_10942 [Aphanomyces invadans]|uniref:Uncharacterized protein n=2 Tax=Aphanomyces invadans TaxID=157072 RepID=A0A024TQ65_9STRA|nr:hypothetical protein H310_10942 [Aphanomyces invadans]ETV95462.1 hypothetical protein H310_10942 [Aphanomyces invadans]|eukprot:XP_008875655.1 hypothetical protein H310_10942 [Aphanomyces invadans]
MSPMKEKTPLLAATSTALSPNHASQTPPFAFTAPEDHRGCGSAIFFTWLTPLMDLGSKKPLEFEDLYQLDRENRAGHVATRFGHFWALEQATPSPSLSWALARAFGRPFVLAGFLRLVRTTLQFTAPIVIKKTIAYLRDPAADPTDGYILVAVIFVSGVISSFCFRQYMYYVKETGLRFRSALVDQVFAKSLRLSSRAQQQRSTGEITNLMSIDAARLQRLTVDLHTVWVVPYLILISCFMLYDELGISFVAGIAVILLVIPITLCLSRVMKRLQKALMDVKDRRVKLCYEVLAGIKVIKLQAWELSFTKRVMEYRTDELLKFRSYIVTQAISSAVYNGVPSLVAMASFVSYVLLGNALDVSTALTSLALFNVLRFPLFKLPQVVNAIVEASVSVKRLRDFLLDEERVVVGPGSLTAPGILVDRADFSFDAASTPPLQNVSLSLQSGDLVAVVGAVGSGKSTLLQGILGDATCSTGHVFRRGRVAYVSQQPFIQNATLRDNILFGLPFEHWRYERAVAVSCLVDDLAMLPFGDRTEIGEKGINLSGGQRTRVALARAIYQDADIYLFDDVLAAVDSHVGADIFHRCMLDILKDKLVVMVTNNLGVLPHCSRILVLVNGHVAQQGSYADLMQTKLELATMVATFQGGSAIDGDAAPVPFELKGNDVASPRPDADASDSATRAVDALADAAVARRKITLSDAGADDDDAAKDAIVVDAIPTAALMVKEDRSTGQVGWPIYLVWIQACGGLIAALGVLVVYLIAQGMTLCATLWLSLWSNHPQPSDQTFYLSIFVVLNVAYILCLFFRAVSIYLFGLVGAKELFQRLITQILRSPMTFFDTTPLGRIVNRLSKDMYTTDEDIPSSFGSILTASIAATSTIGTIVYVTPLFSVVLVPVGWWYLSAQQFFIATSRELQRLDSISRSPVYALLTETLDGMSTIRAYGVEESFRHRLRNLLDTNQRAYLLNFAVNCWLGLRLEFTGTVIATFAAFFAVWTKPTQAEWFAGLAGVSLSYAFQITRNLNIGVTTLSELETEMVSVERIHAYTTLPSEAALRQSENVAVQPMAAAWPSHGRIVFDNVTLQYRAGLPPVLRQLSFTIEPQEKIGVVGRTGAGKSSLVVALLRLVEVQSGIIYIDGIDVSLLGLHDLREKIAIIPQDPVLFSGTVRSNLDPFDLYDDAALWASLTRSHLDHKVASLDDVVEERGYNFSVGERQLLCIARALLKNTRILVMDEATASIDATTDASLQATMRVEFACCTVLTIAHRINTILDSSRILVMDQGAVAEFDTPSALLENDSGIFSSLVSHWRDDAPSL